MKTFIIQFWQKGFWNNLTDGKSFAIEFISLDSAWFVAEKMSKLDSMPVFLNQNYQIKDSSGKIYEMNK